MIRSMTGFGSASRQGERLRAAVTVRSLNHRFLDVTIHAPRRLAPLEPEIKEHVQARLSRGRVDVTVQAKLDDEAQTLAVSGGLVAELVRALRELQVEYRLDGGVSVSDVLHFPGAVEVTEADPGLDPERREAILGLLRHALDGMLEMRSAEGARLEAGLLRGLAAIESSAQRIAVLAEQGKEARREALVEKARALLAELGLEEARLYQEVARAVERYDVAEEVDRLRSHVAMARELLGGAEPAGKRLDFLVQEMMREANTVGSKSASAALAQETVALKGEIERLREQLQNVE
jgi:uncharacterized protein (TIGR00255 family)